MKPTLLTLLLVISFGVARSQLVPHYLPQVGPDTLPGIGFYSFTPADYTTNPANKFPLIIALSGKGETGNGTTDLNLVFNSGIGSLLHNGATMQFSYPNGVHGSFVVLLPQLDGKYKNMNWVPAYVGRMIAWAKVNLNIDPNRIFVTGYSLGGGGCWIYPAAGVDSAMKIAGIVPVSASGLPPFAGENACNIAAGATSVWAIHTRDDTMIPDSISRKIIDSIIHCGPLNPVVLDSPVGNHQIYDNKIFPDTLNNYLYPNVYQWMLGVNRLNTPQNNLPPVANAGLADTTVNVTSSMRFFQKTITGVLSTDPNDLVVKYKWKITSNNLANVFPVNGYAPIDTSTATEIDLDYKNFTWPSRNLEFHALGTYVFRLTVTDMYGATSFVDKTIRLTDNGVNVAPYVNIGNDVTLTAVANDTTVVINAQVFDWESSMNYTLVPAGTNPATVKNDNPNWFATTLHPFITPGVYKFTLTAFDAQGLSTSSTITITKQGTLPVTYLYFKGSNSDGKNFIKWATSKELNNDHFDVLRSDDGRDFTPVVTIPASKATTETKEYSFTDINPLPGNNYYRLAQYDIDGTKKLSEIINVRNTGNALIATYPNPIKDQLYFTLKGDDIKGVVKARILDASGKVVKQLTFEKNNSISNQYVQLPGLQSGIYILELSQDNGWQSVHRFVK